MSAYPMSSMKMMTMFGGCDAFGESPLSVAKVRGAGTARTMRSNALKVLGMFDFKDVIIEVIQIPSERRHVPHQTNGRREECHAAFAGFCSYSQEPRSLPT